MSYVPVTTYVAVPLSPRARELGERLAEVIEHYRHEHPETSKNDVRQAIQLVSARTTVSRALVLAVIGSLLLIALGVAFGLWQAQ